MILYKYLSFNSGKKLIENGRIGFTTAEHFNDPFELRAVNLNFETNPKMNNISEGAFRNRCNGAYAILSLTRQPLNALMWSHYGDSHRGMVVGIDIDEAGLNCEDMNLIPAKYGEIIYTATKPTKKLSAPEGEELLKIGSDISTFYQSNFELFKTAFLYKSLEWSYEEEVRVVKNIKVNNHLSKYHGEGFFENSAGNWQQIQVSGRPLYCLDIPKSSIKEIYMGCNSYKNVTRAGMSDEEVFSFYAQWMKDGIDVFHCQPKYGTWQLEAEEWKSTFLDKWRNNNP